jgi:hypothetical protein
MAGKAETALGVVLSTAAFVIAQSAERVNVLGEASGLVTFLATASRCGRVAGSSQSSTLFVLLTGGEVDTRVAVALPNENSQATSVSAVVVLIARFVGHALGWCR